MLRDSFEMMQLDLSEINRSNLGSVAESIRYKDRNLKTQTELIENVKNFEDFKSMCEQLHPRRDISELFARIRNRVEKFFFEKSNFSFRKALNPVISNGSELIDLEKLVNWLNETQRDPRLNEILHPLYTLDGDSEYSIKLLVQRLHAKLGLPADQVHHGISKPVFQLLVEGLG